MASINDYTIDLVKGSWVEKANATALLATATRAAEGVAAITMPPDGVREPAGARHHVVVKVDASYSTSTQSGLLQVKFGTTVIAEKYIHGAGAIDFGMYGHQNDTYNQAVSAELGAGAGGVVGTIAMTGYTTGPDF